MLEKNKMSRSLWLLFILYFLTLTIASVYAHPDFEVVDETFDIQARDFEVYPLDLHFHRVVGAFQVISPNEGRVEVFIMDVASFDRFSSGRSVPSVYSSGELSKGVLNVLVSCCVDKVYTRYYLVFSNNSDSSVVVDSRISLIHDDLAVTLYDVEPGATLSTITIFAVIGAVLGHGVIRRARNGLNIAVMEKKVERKIRAFSVGSLVTFAFSSSLALAVGISGAVTYGGSLWDGVVGGVADLSLPAGPFGSSFSVLGIIVLLGWLLAVLLWRTSFVNVGRTSSRLVSRIGLAEGILALAFGAISAVYYGSFVPILVTGLVGVPQVLGSSYLINFK